MYISLDKGGVILDNIGEIIVYPVGVQGMGKSSDLEIIKPLEKEWRGTLKKVGIEGIEKKERWSAGYYMHEGLRAYAPDEEARVKTRR